MKRPASAMKKQVVIKPEPMVKKVSKSQAKREAIEPRAKVKPSMPSLPKDGSSPKPVKYWGGIIYTSRAGKKFRALKVKGDTYTEASAAWGSDKPTKSSWDRCCAAIYNHYNVGK